MAHGRITPRSVVAICTWSAPEVGVREYLREDRGLGRRWLNVPEPSAVKKQPVTGALVNRDGSAAPATVTALELKLP